MCNKLLTGQRFIVVETKASDHLPGSCSRQFVIYGDGKATNCNPLRGCGMLLSKKFLSVALNVDNVCVFGLILREKPQRLSLRGKIVVPRRFSGRVQMKIR